ncbi:MAG: site-specific integrase [Lacisediminimonas sp.]|nr:site-specific integrase [Lacisediminimonas sp.]
MPHMPAATLNPSPIPNPDARAGAVFVRRLGPHHFAHLRAVAEGLDITDCARRYLGVEHGHQARAAHQQASDAVRAVARRRGESAWRLIGLRLPGATGSPGSLDTGRPALEDFAAERGLDGFSEAEVLELYEEAWPADRRAARGQRLRERQLALLRRLERLAAETPLASDLVSGWFDDATADKLVAAGIVSLGDLGRRIAAGGRWYRTLPAIGKAKAQRMAHHLATLLPGQSRPTRAVFALAAAPALFEGPSPCAAPSLSPSTSQSQSQFQFHSPPSSLPGARVLGSSPARLELAGIAGQPAPGLQAAAARPATSLLQARNDSEAVSSWIQARAGSVATARVYRREAMRLLLWLQYECQGARLAQMSVNLCGDYMAFLQNIPAHWISRVRAAPQAPGWAPFRGPLSHASHRQAIVIIASLFTWLQAAQYLSANPWLLVNQNTGDDRSQKMLDTKAFSETAMREIMRFIDAQAPSPSRERIRFILSFVEAVGLRSAELLQARLGDFQMQARDSRDGTLGDGRTSTNCWVMQVHGKGAKNRIAAVPGQAFAALQAYLQARHLGGVETAPPGAPLLASTRDAMAPLGYQALYEHVKGWLARAVRSSSLPAAEREKLAGATTHWLRHTFGTRAIAREVPLDVIQAQMGHASIQTTTAIYGRAPIRRRMDELGKAFG